MFHGGRTMKTFFLFLALSLVIVMGCSKDSSVNSTNDSNQTGKVTGAAQSTDGDHEFEGKEDGEFGSQDADDNEIEDAGSEAEDEGQAVTNLPEAVKSAVENAYPDGVMGEVATELDSNGTLSYEVKLTENNKDYEVAVTQSGEIVEVTEKIAVDTLPAMITDSVTNTYPNGTIREAERVNENNMVFFEVELVNGGEKTELILDTAGTIIDVSAESESAESENDGSNHEFEGEETGDH